MNNQRLGGFLLGWIWLVQGPSELLHQAREALDARRPEETLRLLRDYFASGERLPEDVSSLSDSRYELRAAYLLRGAAYQSLGASAKAAEDFGRAIEIEPEDVPARMSLGRILLRQARLPEAREHFARAAEREAKNAEAHHLLGVIHLDLSREPRAPREKELLDARRALETALALNPAHAPTVALLTVVLDELRLFDESERVFSRALEAWRGSPELLKELAFIYSRLLNFARAARAFEILPAEGPDAGFRAFHLGNCYRETRRHEEAMRLLLQATALDPENGIAHFMLGSVLVRLGKFEEARAALEKALQDDAVGAQARNEMARLLASRGELDAAIAQCREAIELRPDLAEAHYQLGQFLARTGRVEEASGSFERFEALKKAAEEIQRYTGRLSHYTDDVPSYLELARLYREQGRADKAADVIRQAARIDPDRLAIPLAMADLLIEQGLYAEALSYSRQVLAIEPRNRAALWQVSAIHLGLNDSVQAEESLRHLLDVEPGHARGLNDLGVLLERTGRDSEATAAFERAIAAKPEFALPHNGLGVVSFKQGEYARSAKCFEKVVELAPAYAQARLNLAEAYRRLGRAADAEAQMREYEKLQAKAIEFDPLPRER